MFVVLDTKPQCDWSRTFNFAALQMHKLCLQFAPGY